MRAYQGGPARNRGGALLRVAALIACLAAALGLAACGSSTSSSSPSSSSASGSSSPSGAASPAGAATTSADQGAALTVGTSADFPPMSFKDPSSGQIDGFENDMLNYTVPKMDKTFTWQQLDFNGLIPALQSGRLSLVVSGVYDTAAREKIVDFVDYMKVPLAVMTLKGNIASAKDPMALCGKAIAYLVGSAPEAGQLTQWSQQCASAGQPAITQRGYQTVAAAVADIANGRTFGELESDIVVLYVSQTQYGSKLGTAFDVPGGVSTIGVAVAKNSPLLPALKTAVADFIASPAYCAAASKWGLTAGDLMRAC